MSQKSAAQQAIAYAFSAYEPRTEYRFHPKRLWRFDVAFPGRLLAVEVDGGVWTGGRHTRGAGYQKDIEKLTTAYLMGWLVIRVTPDMVLGRAREKYPALDWIADALANRYVTGDSSCQRIVSLQPRPTPTRTPSRRRRPPSRGTRT